MAGRPGAGHGTLVGGVLPVLDGQMTPRSGVQRERDIACGINSFDRGAHIGSDDDAGPRDV